MHSYTFLKNGSSKDVINYMKPYCAYIDSKNKYINFNSNYCFFQFSKNNNFIARCKSHRNYFEPSWAPVTVFYVQRSIWWREMFHLTEARAQARARGRGQEHVRACHGLQKLRWSRRYSFVIASKLITRFDITHTRLVSVMMARSLNWSALIC